MGTLYLDGVPSTYLALSGGDLTDDAVLGIGSGAPASILWETQDANANELLISLPTGGSVDVPVIVIGQGVSGVDLGLYNGVVDPRIAMFGIGAVTTGPIWEFRKARGTVASPTAVTSGDDLGFINAWCCVAAGEWSPEPCAAIEFDSTGTIATTRGPGLIRIRAATNAAPSVLTDVAIFNATGTIIRGATNPGFMLKAVAGPAAAIRNEGDSAYLPMYASTFVASAAVDVSASGVAIQFGTTSSLQGYSGTAWRNILTEAAGGTTAVSLSIGRDDTDLTLNAINDQLVLQAGGGTGNEAAGFGFGISVKIGNAASEVEERGSIDLRLVTATNGSEDSGWDFSTMAAGAINLAFKVDQNGELYGDADSSSGTYMAQNVNLFDEFDDAEELRRFQLTVSRTGLIPEEQRLANRRRMVELGVFEENPQARSGYMMRMQTMTRLLAGGIWQTRQSLEQLRNEVLDRIERLEGAKA